MMKLAFGILLASAVVSVSYANAGNDCKGCGNLKQVIQEYKVKTDLPESAYDNLQLKATAIIQKMPNKQGKLTRAQVKQIVATLRVATPVDPAEAIFTNNINIIDKNKALFDKEIATLPKLERKEIEAALAVARSTVADELPTKKN